jgi:TonB family protein
MKRQALAFWLTLGLFSGLAALELPAFAKARHQQAQQNDSTYEYVSRVFDKLKTHWEPPAYEQTLSNSLLTFVLNDDGTLYTSKLKTVDADNGSGQRALDFIKNNAPFGKLPAALQGSQLEFKFKITSDSLQMVSYQVVSKQNKEPVVKYNNPSNGAMLGASLFYMAAQAPITGQVSWQAPETQTDAEQSMTLYVNDVQERIQQEWRLPEGVSSSERAVAYLMIDRDGSLLSASLKQSSGNKAVDQAALSAITSSAPFPRVPASALSLPVEIEYVFERVAPEPSDAQ